MVSSTPVKGWSLESRVFTVTEMVIVECKQDGKKSRDLPGHPGNPATFSREIGNFM
jgi:hypothetical protein